ncbi:MAG: hypothetical protein K6T66_03765 [Peptococcaceae bacterium]|nr:hypothetical protein [Peptococcaceae bacterium]
MDVLRPGGTGPVISYREDCQSCFLCFLECPTGAIRVTPWRSFPLGKLYGRFDPEGKGGADLRPAEIF